MPTRSRSRSNPSYSGYYRRGSNWFPRNSLSGDQGTVDVTGTLRPYKADNPFRTHIRDYSRVKSMKSVLPTFEVFGRVHPTALSNGRAYSLSAPDEQAALLAYNAKALALTNPSKPSVDLPVSILELKDLPRMIQLAGYSILRREGRQRIAKMIQNRRLGELVADGNLNYQFGWNPLFSDLEKLRQLSKHVANRQRVLDKLAAGGGIRRKVSLEHWAVSDGPYLNNLVESAYVSVYAHFTGYHESKTWATVRYAPDLDHLSALTDPDLAWKIALGLEPSFATFISQGWELIPFSWLADWFTNLGDILMSNRNTVPAKFVGGSIMRTRSLRISYVPAPGYSNIWEGGDAYEIVKVRTPMTNASLPTFGIPFLNARQLSIVGSFSVLQAKAWGLR